MDTTLSPTPTPTFSNAFTFPHNNDATQEPLTPSTIKNHTNTVYAKLVLLSTNTAGLPQEVEIKTQRFRIGRDRHQADLHLEPEHYERMISRVHCTIIVTEGLHDGKYHFRIVDNKSVNGTFVNATRIDNCELNDGDYIVFTGGCSIPIGKTVNPYNNGGKQITSSEKSDISGMPLTEVQELLREKLSNSFIYRFVVVNDQIQIHDEDTSMQGNSPTSMNGSFHAKRKFEDISQRTSFITSQPVDMPDAKRIRMSQEEELKSQVEVLQAKIEENESSFIEQRQTLETQLSELKIKLEQEQSQHEAIVKEMQSQLEVQKQAVRDTPRNSFPIEDIEKEFTCAICHELIVNAATLQCSHTFCKPCLAEWMKQKKVCPICRKRLTKPPTRNLTMENVLDKLVKNLSQEDQETRENRRKEIIDQEERASQKLKELVENARGRGVKFLNVQDIWSNDERRVFKTGVSKHEGRARLMYCELTGFNAEWIKRANTQLIVRACQNLEIEIPKTKTESTNGGTASFFLDYELAREKLLDFLDGDVILFFN